MVKVSNSVCGICNCVIKDNTLFSALSSDEIDAFKDVVRTSFHPKKDMIYMEGDDCRGLYVVRAGRVKLIRSSKDGREHIVKLLGPGEILGLEVFGGVAKYELGAVAMEDADLCFMATRDFFSILKREGAIAVKIAKALGVELLDAYKKIGTLGLLNAREKLAHLLYTLATEYGEQVKGGVRLQLTLSRLDIAEMLGITQETSIRLLKSFKEDGILAIKRKEIIIASMKRLAELGGIGA
ncbi:MAG: Crp/Fnr family transcriptional regulator [Deltaproteobacteria bacterium]|nr:Crp/Fnr family transcriptional regulator [Deltaproteobacteria bacterium]